MNIRLTLLLIVTNIAWGTISAEKRPPILWNLERLQSLTQDSLEYKSILKIANRYLGKPSIVVTDKIETISTDIHNYESLSTYYWEDETNPEGPYVYRDGQKNPERLKYDGAKINDFSLRIKNLTWAYVLTHDDMYADQWLKDMKAWFVTDSTRMNPNFEYAQIVKNTQDNRGNFYGIIDAYVMIDVIESLLLMRLLDVCDEKTFETIRDWCNDFAQWMRESDNGKRQSKASNNLSIAYDVMMCEFYYCISDDERLDNIVDSFQVKRLEKQFLSDGTQPQELKRAKPMSYCIYNLEHVLDFCTMQWSMGVNYYSQNKQLIDAAMNYVGNVIDHVDNLNNAEIKDLQTLKKKYALLSIGFENIQ